MTDSSARMTSAEMIDVIQHHEQGGEVEFLAKSQSDVGWQLANPPLWDFPVFLYRKKPEPLMLWVNIVSYEFIRDGTNGRYCHNSKDQAIREAAENGRDKYSIIAAHMIEVIE